jgi:hypothetical protein
MLSGSYRHIAGGAGFATLTPDLTQMEKAISMVGAKRPEREALVLDLTAMCAEYCAVLNKRKPK